MFRRSPAFLLLIGLQAPLFAQSAVPPPTEAPAGFDTPTLVGQPGSQSHSNGIQIVPAGDSFALDQQIYEKEHDVLDGLGPVFNARSCVDCHANPVSGGASQFTEVRAGHRANGKFAGATVSIDGGAASIPNRSIINQRAVDARAQEHVPNTENLRELRATLSTLGDGFVEAIDDQTLINIANSQPRMSRGRIHGEYNLVPILEAANQTRVGRFGWKDQHGSLLSFVADAYVNEMGITSRLHKADVTNVGKVTPDPEDQFDNLGLEDIDHFTQFLRGTKVPPRDPALQTNSTLKASADAGERIFDRIGCVTCHVDTIVTAKPGTKINGGFVIPAALTNKIIHPYSDFLLHDIGTAGGIVQTAQYQDSAFKFRTSALWGLRTRTQYMHDLRSLTLENAILRHQGEAEHVTRLFFEGLSEADRQHVIDFLNTL